MNTDMLEPTNKGADDVGGVGVRRSTESMSTDLLERKKDMEFFLNVIAFSQRRQQRHLFPDDTTPPPPRTLTNDSADVSAATFTRLVESRVQAKDLKSAGVLLLEMENFGFSVPDKLLDKVLELHYAQKGKGTLNQGGQATQGTDDENEGEADDEEEGASEGGATL